jgi:hypothetical protein
VRVRRRRKGLDSAARINQHGRVPEPGLRAGDLLAGPRGRELCARLAGMDVREIRDQLAPPSSAALARVPGVAGFGPLAEAEPPGEDDDDQPPPFPSDRDDPLAVIAALADVAEDAGYWGSYRAPDPLGDPAVIAGLRPVADRLAGSAGCRWWWSGPDRAAQRYVASAGCHALIREHGAMCVTSAAEVIAEIPPF